MIVLAVWYRPVVSQQLNVTPKTLSYTIYFFPILDKANSEADANTNTEDVKTESIESGSVDERNEINLTESGHGKADWSDWEGERRSDPEDDPDYDHEIEEELRQMGSASPKKSFMPIDPNPPVRMA